MEMTETEEVHLEALQEGQEIPMIQIEEDLQETPEIQIEKDLQEIQRGEGLLEDPQEIPGIQTGEGILGMVKGDVKKIVGDMMMIVTGVDLRKWLKLVNLWCKFI